MAIESAVEMATTKFKDRENELLEQVEFLNTQQNKLQQMYTLVESHNKELVSECGNLW